MQRLECLLQSLDKEPRRVLTANLESPLVLYCNIYYYDVLCACNYEEEISLPPATYAIIRISSVQSKKGDQRIPSFRGGNPANDLIKCLFMRRDIRSTDVGRF